MPPHARRGRQVIAIYFSIGCLFIPIGAKCLLTSRSVRALSRAQTPGRPLRALAARLARF
jgi:hypothetical protein